MNEGDLVEWWFSEYVPCDGNVQFDVRFDGHDVWLSQQQISELYGYNMSCKNDPLISFSY